MKKVIFILGIFLCSIFSFGQNVVSSSTDDFGNYVMVENQIETTHFELLGKNAMFTVNNGNVSFFSTKYSINLPSNMVNQKYTDWSRKENILHLTQKNIVKLYNALENMNDAKISGAKVFASNKYCKSTRVIIEVTTKIFEDRILGNDTVLYISQRSYNDIHPVLDQDWFLRGKDIITLKNVLSKYIKDND